MCWIGFKTCYIRLDPSYIYKTGSKKCIRLDPRNPFRRRVSPAPSLVPASAFVTCRPHVMSQRLMQMSKHASWNVTRVTTCHDLSHVRGCLFRWEGLCCHSSWYLLSLTLVIGFVTATSRLYKLTDEPRYHSVHDHIERCESSYYLIQSPDFPFFQFTQSTIII